ncbi:hypothetical protein MMPV_006347 [Pyropia vietnamensis]
MRRTGGPGVPHPGVGGKLDLAPLARHAADDAALLATVVARLEDISSSSASASSSSPVSPLPSLEAGKWGIVQRRWSVVDDSGMSDSERGASDGSVAYGDADGYRSDSSSCHSGWSMSLASDGGGVGSSDGNGSWASVGSNVTAVSAVQLSASATVMAGAGAADNGPTLASAVRSRPSGEVHRPTGRRWFFRPLRSRVTATSTANEESAPVGSGRFSRDHQAHVAVELGITPGVDVPTAATAPAVGPSSAGAKAARQAAALWRWGRSATSSEYASGGGVCGGGGGSRWMGVAMHAPWCWRRALASAGVVSGGGGGARSTITTAAPWSHRALVWTCVAAAVLSPLLLFLM